MTDLPLQIPDKRDPQSMALESFFLRSV